MGFIDWAFDVAAAHPDLTGALIDVDGEWLDILLPDGRTFRFRPGQMIDESKPEPVRRKLLDRLISIGVARAESAPSESAPAESEPSESWPSASARFESDASDAGEPEADAAFDRSSGSESFDEAPPEDEPSAVAAERLEPLDASSGESVLAHIMPIVRSADYFVASHDHARDDSMIYVPLTPFVGAGIAIDGRDLITPMYFSDAERLGLPTDIVGFFQQALMHLRTSDLTNGQPSVQVQPGTLAGAQIFEFAGPPSYQSSWFMDVEMALTVAESLSSVHDDGLALFVPASRDLAFVVMADDPHLAPLFQYLSRATTDAESIYPLPHVVTGDGWSEWIPMNDHPAARILSKIRARSRAAIYSVQEREMRTWPNDFGKLAPFEVIRDGALTSSATRWTSLDGFGSVPDAEYIDFVRQRSPHPWDAETSDRVRLRTQVARDVWHEGMSPMHNVWPPRWNVAGFPDDAQMAALKEASTREF